MVFKKEKEIEKDMDLIIGGAFQGKKEYVKERYKIEQNEIFMGETDDYPKEKQGYWSHIKAIADFHLLVLRWIRSEDSIEKMTEMILDENPNIIIITNEIGCGIVPIDPKEREWREKTGRICCDLAKKANQVIRVYLSTPVVIKEK